MTIEEAIKIINSAMTSYGEDAIDYDEVFEAKDMAIRSLENKQELKKAIEKIKNEIEELYNKQIVIFRYDIYKIIKYIIDKHMEGLI